MVFQRDTRDSGGFDYIDEMRGKLKNNNSVIDYRSFGVFSHG